MLINPITHGIFDPAVPRGGVDSTPQLENTLGGVWDQLFFYRIMNLHKTRQILKGSNWSKGIKRIKGVQSVKNV